jgi:hypothetical protein
MKTDKKSIEFQRNGGRRGIKRVMSPVLPPGKSVKSFIVAPETTLLCYP